MKIKKNVLIALGFCALLGVSTLTACGEVTEPILTSENIQVTTAFTEKVDTEPVFDIADMTIVVQDNNIQQEDTETVVETTGVPEAIAETTTGVTEATAETTIVSDEVEEIESQEYMEMNEMQEFINKIIENQDKELQANIADSMDTMFCSMSYISAINKESLGIDYSPYIQAYRDYVSQSPDDLAAEHSKDYPIKNVLDSINYLEAFKNTTGDEYPDESSFERMYEASANMDMLSIIAEDYKEYYASGVVTVGDNQFVVVALKVKYGHNTEWVTEYDYYNIETGEMLGKSFKTGIEPVYRYSLNGSLLMTIDDAEGFSVEYVWDTAAQFAPVNEYDEAAFTEHSIELDILK